MSITTREIDGLFYDKGGATINAMHSDFDPDTTSQATRAATVQRAITYSAGLADPRPVYVPEPLQDYDASAVTFDSSVKMVREGGDPGVYDALAYGFSENGTVVTNKAAIDAAIAAGSLIVIDAPGNYEVNGFDVPINKVLRIGPGVILKPGSQSIGISGTLEAGSYQIISSTNVTSTNPPLIFRTVADLDTQQRIALATWWGAKGDSSTDNSVPLQQAFIAVTNNATEGKNRSGVALKIPAGQYNYSTTLTIKNATPTATASAHGLSIEGAVGGMYIGSTASMTGLTQTRLHYTGTGVGITLGTASFTQRGGVIRNLWFSGTTSTTDLIRAWASGFVFENCTFSGAGDSGADSGLHWTAFQSTIRSCTFQDNYNGLWLSGSTTTTIRDCTFQENRGTYALVTIGLQFLIESNVFQGNESNAIGLDMGSSFGTSGINGVTIANNYWEDNAAGTNDRIVVRGENASNRVKNVWIRDNYVSSYGVAATNFIVLINTTNIHIGPNVFPDPGSVAEVDLATGADRPVGVFLDVNEMKHLSASPHDTSVWDLSGVLSNSGMASSTLTIDLPRAVEGLEARVFKMDAGDIILDASSSDSINGAATSANTTAGEAGAASIHLRAVTSDNTAAEWVSSSEIGTWG